MHLLLTIFTNQVYVKRSMYLIFITPPQLVIPSDLIYYNTPPTLPHDILNNHFIIEIKQLNDLKPQAK